LLALLASAAKETLPSAPLLSAAMNIASPATVGDFHLVDSPKGTMDVSGDGVRYVRQTPGREVAITVRMFPAPAATGTTPANDDAVRAQQCDGQFHGIGRRVTIAHPGAELAHESLETLPQLGTEFEGRKAVYRLFDQPWFGRRQDLRSEVHLFCFVRGAWMVEYRVDYPSGYDASAAVTAFMRDLKWTIPAK
jgi:hypothetical protein